jgi:hypothetical protein
MSEPPHVGCYFGHGKGTCPWIELESGNARRGNRTASYGRLGLAPIGRPAPEDYSLSQMNSETMQQKNGRRLWSFAACLLAVVLLFGGPWPVLQVIAWARMVVVYSQQGSFAAALVKTFDGRHPCALCLEIRSGQQEDQHKDHQNPRERSERMTELFCDAQRMVVPLAPTAVLEAPRPLSDSYSRLIEAPPTPPPRLRLEVL